MGRMGAGEGDAQTRACVRERGEEAQRRRLNVMTATVEGQARLEIEALKDAWVRKNYPDARKVWEGGRWVWTRPEFAGREREAYIRDPQRRICSDGGTCCVVGSCTNKMRLRGRCDHHARILCTFTGCCTPSEARGLCMKHGARGVCSVPGCAQVARKKTPLLSAHLVVISTTTI